MSRNVETPVVISQRNGWSTSAVREKTPLAPRQRWQWDLDAMGQDGYFLGDPIPFVRDRGARVSDEPSSPHDGSDQIYITAGSPMPDPAQTLVAVPARSGLLQHPMVRRILRYCSVSVVSTVIGLTVLGVLVGGFGWSAVWANVMATVIGLPPSFELSRRWVWAHDGRRSILRQAAPYAAVSFAGLIVSSIAVHLAANATVNSTRLVHTVAVELANIAAYGSLWIVQFVVCDRILFRSRAKPAGGTNPGADNVPPLTGLILPSEVMV
jgi:putative flippase GtrA